MGRDPAVFHCLLPGETPVIRLRDPAPDAEGESSEWPNAS